MDSIENELKETYGALGELMGCMGIMDAMIEATDVEALKEGWSARLEEIRNWAEKQTSDFADFGSAYDEEDSGEDSE